MQCDKTIHCTGLGKLVTRDLKLNPYPAGTKSDLSLPSE